MKAAILSLFLLAGFSLQAADKIRVEFDSEPAVVLGERKITIGDAIRTVVEQNHDLLSRSFRSCQNRYFLPEIS